MALSIEKCTTENYGKFIEIANKAFNKDESDWFSNNMGHIFLQPEDPMFENFIKNNYLFFYDDIPAGTIGVYPLNIMMGELNLKVAGIGTVGVLDDLRGKGIMAFMIKSMLKEIDNSDYDLSWLAGERLRYKNFGFDLGGKTLKIQMDKKSFRKITKIDKIVLDHPNSNDINLFEKSYEKYQNRVLRSREKWKRHLNRETLSWYFDGDKSYFVFIKDNPQVILECAGDFDQIYLMLKTHFENHSLQELDLIFPFEHNEFIIKFMDISSGYVVTSCNQIRICDRFHKNSEKFMYCSEILSRNPLISYNFFINEIDKV